jgi:pentatricopeptide repeat protein
MIRARLDYVKSRQRGDLIRYYDPYPSSGESQPEFVCQTRATAETFSLLAENYCSRRLHARLQELFDVLKQAEIGTTSFLMNQLVRSYSQSGDAEAAVNLYRTMTRDQQIRPDGHTFLTLFNTLSVNRLIQRDPDSSRRDMTLGRDFFRDMVDADWAFDGPDIFAQLPRTILFSMLKAKDYTGMLVAARAMRLLFAFHPPEMLLLELVSGAGSLQVKSQRNLERLISGRRTLEALTRKHRTALLRAGRRPDVEVTDEEKAEEQHTLLEHIVLLKAGAQDADPAEVEAIVEEAAREMGVYEIVVARDAGEIARRRKLGKGWKDAV